MGRKASLQEELQSVICMTAHPAIELLVTTIRNTSDHEGDASKYCYGCMQVFFNV